MAGPTRDELRRKFRQSAHNAQWDGWEVGELGIIDASGNRVVDAPGRPGWVWVRLLRGDGITAVTAICTNVRVVYGLKVRVGKTPDGSYKIMGLNDEAMVAEVGAAAATLALPAVATLGLIPPSRLEMGLVVARQIGPAYTMKVYVYPLGYIHRGAYKLFAGGWLDLTSNIPATADTRRLVLVGIDPATGALTASNGEEHGIAATLGHSHLQGIDLGGMVPLAAVNLHYGMTAVTRETQILEARSWLNDSEPRYRFTDLADAPAGYAGHAGKLVVVNAAETGLEFQGATGAGPFDVDLPPSTPSAYDDEFDDGTLAAAWAEVDPDSKLTVAEAGGVLTLTMDQAYWLTYVSGPVGVSRPAPSGDFQVVTKVRLHQTGSNTTWGYVLLTFPTAGLLAGVSVDQSATFRHIELGVKDDPDGYFSSIDPATDASGAVDEWMYLRLRYDSVNKILALDYGADGLTWRVNATRDVSGIGEAPTTVWLSVGCTATVMGDEATAEFEFFRVVEAFGASTDPIYGDNGAPLALDAGQVGYTPATGTDWTDPDPTTVQAALDALAEAVVAGDDTLDMSSADVSSPPTSAELDSAFGAPATVGAGYTALLDDGGAGSAVYLVASDGTSWWYTALTKAT